MGYILLLTTTFLASLLTFFSGFGLGTLLLPLLTLFFPVELAILYTAVVHLFNNLYKTILLKGSISARVALQFGGTAILGSLLGALLLSSISNWNLHYTLQIFGVPWTLHPLKMGIGFLLLYIGLNELYPIARLDFSGRGSLLAGGLVSGFFGGLAGLQGAFRSYFLVKSTEDKWVFLGTSAAVALLVDLARLLVYTGFMVRAAEVTRAGLGVLLAALLGIYVGKRLLPAVKTEAIHQLIAYLLVLFGLLLGVGIV